MGRWVLATIAMLVLLVDPVRADEVLFVNGDRLTGTITHAVGGKLTVKSDTVGVVTVDLAKVKTFSTVQPVQLHVGDKTVLSGPVSTAADGTVTVSMPGAAGPHVVALKDLTKIGSSGIRVGDFRTCRYESTVTRPAACMSGS